MTKEILATLIVESVHNNPTFSAQHEAVMAMLDPLQPADRQSFSQWGMAHNRSTPAECWPPPAYAQDPPPGTQVINFNSLRVRAAYALDRMIKHLNKAIVPGTAELILETSEMEEDIHQLSQLMRTLLCCHIPGNPDVEDVSDKVEETGGIAEFNPQND